MVLQAIIGSFIIHVIYIVGIMLVGYIKTKNYKPDISSVWDRVDTIEKEVVIVGKVTPPYFYVLSFLGVAVICRIVIMSFDRLFN